MTVQQQNNTASLQRNKYLLWNLKVYIYQKDGKRYVLFLTLKVTSRIGKGDNKQVFLTK